jgi:hypothetical protein
MNIKNQREKSGILFKNNRKTEERHSDYAGTATIEGVEYWLNAWIREGKNGKFMGLSFKSKNVVERPKLRVVGGNDPNDDIPF